jgi:hypothetical protein
MADQTRRPEPGGDPIQKNPEDNAAQAGSDATADAASAELGGDFTEQSDRAHGRGSDANGLAEFDEADGEKRKRLYDETGSPIVSRID